MDRMQTRFKVADNSGAKEVGLITVLRSSKRPTIGSIIVVSVKEIHTHSKVRRGEVYKAVVIRTREPYRRKDGTYIKFQFNYVVLLKENTVEPLSSRIHGAVPIELKEKGFVSLATIAEVLV